MLKKVLFVVMASVAYFATAVAADIETGGVLESRMNEPALGMVTMTPDEAYTALRSSYAANNEADVMDLLTTQKQMLLASKEGLDLALEASIRYGTLDQAKALFKDAGAWWRFNKEVFLREIGDNRGQFQNVTISGRNKLLFDALTAAVRRTDSTAAMAMTDFLFDQLSLTLYLLPPNNLTFFYNTFILAAEHTNQNVADHLLNRWLSINKNMGHLHMGLIIFTVTYPVFTSVFFGILSLGHHDSLYNITLASELAVGAYLLLIAWKCCDSCCAKSWCEPEINIWPDNMFAHAAEYRHAGVVRYFLTPHTTLPFPTQSTLICAYRELQSYRSRNSANATDAQNTVRDDMIRSIGQYIPAAARQDYAQGRRGGLAFEIHDYADQVNGPVMACISRRVGTNVPQVNEIALRARLRSLVYGGNLSFLKRIINWGSNREQLDLAHTAINCAWQPDTPVKLNKILFFLDTYYPDRINQWMTGFVGESIEAYQNSINSLSCVKGINERMVTGLRGIDPELDDIFAPAEGDLYAKKILRNIDFNVNAQKVAEELMKVGITLASSLEGAREAYKQFLCAEIEKNHVKAADYEADIAVVLETFDSVYDETIKPKIQPLVADMV